MIFISAPADFSPKFEVVSCFCECDGQLLLLKRQDHKSEGNKWGVPAGKIDQGEQPIEAMVRELKEETGLNIEAENLKYLNKVFVHFPVYDFVYYMFSVQLAAKPKVIISPAEHTDHVWVTPNEALKLELVRDLDECIKLHYTLTNLE